nr:SEC14 domain and spectrin repeat-containing protein 1-B-like [Biomphalaria glabrata]
MNQGNLQDPNTSFGSQGRFSDVQDPNTSRSSIRKGPSVPARVDSRHGSLRRQQDYNSGGVAVPSGIFVSNQGQGSNYQQQFENPEYYQIGQNQPSSRPGSTRSSAAYTSQQPPEYYQLQTSPKHSPRDSGYQPTPTGTLQKKDSHRMSSQRDYDGVIKRQRSFQEAQYRPTSRAGSVQSAGAGTHRSTGSSIYGLLAEGHGLNSEHLRNLLQHGFVLLTGGRDTQGGPIITLPSMQNRNDPSPDELITCLKYLIQIPSEETKKKGYSVVVDTRDGSWANLGMVMSSLKQTIGGYLKQVLVLVMDFDKRFNLSRSSSSEPLFVTISLLHRYIDTKQLTSDLGGQMEYYHDMWLHTQWNYENFMKDSREVIEYLDRQEVEIQHSYDSNVRSDPPSSPLEALRKHRQFKESIKEMPVEVIRQGQELLTTLSENRLSGYSDNQGFVPTLDNLEVQKQVKRVLQYLTNKVDKLQDYLEDKDRSMNSSIQYEEWKRNIKTVINWVLGPGEKLLASQSDIGDSYESAEELRKRHEEMEIKCTDTYGQYAELRHTAEEILKEGLTAEDDLKAERDYMDTVCRSFASRLDRRRTLLITSVRFHRFAEDFSQLLDELLVVLCSDIQADTVESVEEAMKTLQDKCDACDKIAEESLNDGQSLLDEMSRPIKNAFGKDITPDYSSKIKDINKRLGDLQERKLRCDELADVRKLKLQQFLQLRTCERDTDQAIDWINELCDVMVTEQTDLGRNSEEAEALHEQHKKFAATAEGTYDYGKGLLQAALVLRRSLRQDIEPNNEQARRLEEAWKRFSQGTSEQANRLTVCAMFFNESDKLMNEMENFITACARALSGEDNLNDAVKNLPLPKAQLGKDFDNASRMGQALIERLSMPIILSEGNEKKLAIDEEGAADMVGSHLRKLDKRMSEADHFWDEVLKAHNDPNFQTKHLERQPSERKKEKPGQKPRQRTPSERKRRSDPFGIASRRRVKPGQDGQSPTQLTPSLNDADKMNKSYDAATLPNNGYAKDRRGLNRSYDSSPGDLQGQDDLDGSPSYRSSVMDQRLRVVPTPTVRKTVQAKLQQQQQPRLDLNQGKIVATQTPTYANAAPPSEVYDPLYSNQPVQPRQHKDILGLDWLSLMYNPRSSLADQLHQVSSS